MKESDLTVGLLAGQDEDWLAGSFHVQAVARSLSALPETLRPSLDLLIRRDMNQDLYMPIEDLISVAETYDCHRPYTFTGRFQHACMSLLQKQHLPRWLDDAAKCRHVDVLAPCMQSLGSDFSLPWVGWVPDFQHLYLPEMLNEDQRKTRDRNYQAIVDDASHVVVGSNQASDDLQHHHGADPGHISVYRFRALADPDWFDPDPKTVANDYGLPERFLMFPSQYWRHKDHLVLIEAIAAMKQGGHKDVCLVLTGKGEDRRHPGHPVLLQDRISELGLEKQVRQLGPLPRMQQLQLMRRACAIVSPSRFEGWSMLVEDCRCLGKMVVLSDISVHREQAYPQARFFGVGDVDGLASLLSEQWSDLSPGPNLILEKEAREENERLMLENGEMLLQLFKRITNR